MVYATGAWGMGETDAQYRNANDTSPIASSLSQDQDEEVALHPLNNQVSESTRPDLRACVSVRESSLVFITGLFMLLESRML
jgi:uridine kinase